MENNQLSLAFKLLDSMGVPKAGGQEITLSLVSESEKRLGVVFPDDYKEFLTRYGCVAIDDLLLFGLGVPSYLIPHIESACLLAYSFCQDAPEKLLPFHFISKGVFACFDCSTGVETSKVFLWDTSKQVIRKNLIHLSDSFGEYVFRIISDKIQRDQSVQKLEQHVKEFASKHKYSHAEGGELPSNHEWRPYRFCVQDVLLGATVVCHSREKNRLEVDVFLTTDIPYYEAGAGVKALATFIFSEAYKCGGTMEIQFTKEVDRKGIPEKFNTLAKHLGVSISNPDKGNLNPAEAKEFYAKLTGFSNELVTKMKELEQDGRIKSVRASYVVHHGVWTREQVEMIVLGSEQPDRILGGFAQPQHRHLYYHDLLHARAALLGGLLDRTLSKRYRSENDQSGFDLEDDFLPLRINFDGQYFAKKYHCDEEIRVPWIYPEDPNLFINSGKSFNILIRARNKTDLKLHLNEDIKQAIAMQKSTGNPTFLLFPHDFFSLEEDVRNKIDQSSKLEQIGILVSPEFVLALDDEASKKLAQSRILRQ